LSAGAINALGIVSVSLTGLIILVGDQFDDLTRSIFRSFGKELSPDSSSLDPGALLVILVLLVLGSVFGVRNTRA
jgi:hypothetical protein